MAAMRTSVGSGSGSGSSRGSLQVPSTGYKAHGHGHGHGHGQAHGQAHDYAHGYAHSHAASSSISIESLVEHLLAAKRALSSMTAVLRAKEIVTHARAEHEDAAIRAAHAGFVRRAISDQTTLLMRMRQSLQVTYVSRRRRFDKLTRIMDAAHQRLQGAMDELRSTTVQETIRPDGEPSKTLLDFLDQKAVGDLVEAMRKSLKDLHVAQQSFDGDLLRFDNDVRAIGKALSEAPASPPQSTHSTPVPELLASLVEHSGHMALLLTSLNQHFDHCVTAVRITDGGTAVARRKAAEDCGDASGSGSGQVSISGYIAEQESHLSGNLEPMSPDQRDALMDVVLSDAAEVNDVVGEIRERLSIMEEQSASLHDQISATRATHAAVLSAHRVLEEVESRLGGYVAAENEFTTRWDVEQTAILGFVDQMGSLHGFYQSYASAYAGLVLEVKRRTSVEQRIEDIWRKARESVDRLVDEDWKQREAFRLEAGEYLPGDLWAGVQHNVTRWDVVPVTHSQDPRREQTEKQGGADKGQAEKRDPAGDRPNPGPTKPARSDWRNSIGGRSSGGR